MIRFESLKKWNPFHHYRSFSHWFSYHWRAVVCVVLLVLVGVYFRFLPQEQDPDYVICWVGQQLLSEQQEQSLTQQVQAAGTDVNGDGEIIVRIDQYAITFGDDNMEDDALADSYTYLTKLLNSIQTTSYRLYLMDDPEGFQRVTGILQYLDGTIPSENDNYECANWEEMCLPFESDALEEPVYLGRCCLFSGEDPEELFPGADALFEALTQ